MTSFKENILFLKNFIRSPLKNASITPSSAEASRMMVKGIDFSKVGTIVELGPGNGVFTEAMLKRCRKDAKIILIELEISYIGLLKEKFGGRVIIENSCASWMDDIMMKHNIGSVDLIISGLPFLPERPKNKLMKSIRRETEKGAVFRLFTYMPYFMKDVYKDLPIQRKYFTWKNIPPFWVYGIN